MQKKAKDLSNSSNCNGVRIKVFTSPLQLLDAKRSVPMPQSDDRTPVHAGGVWIFLHSSRSLPV